MLQLPNKPKTKKLIELKKILDITEATTTSRKIAKEFDKRHDDVLKVIRNILGTYSKDFNARNFTEVKYLDKKGENRSEYIITYDGFILIAMGFTGKRVVEHKERFMKLFRAMLDYIKQNEIYRLSVDSRNRMNEAICKSGLTAVIGDIAYKEIASILNMLVFRTTSYPFSVSASAKDAGYSSVRDYIRNDMQKEERQMKFLEDYICNILNGLTVVDEIQYRQLLQNVTNLAPFIVNFN